MPSPAQKDIQVFHGEERAHWQLPLGQSSCKTALDIFQCCRFKVKSYSVILLSSVPVGASKHLKTYSKNAEVHTEPWCAQTGLISSVPHALSWNHGRVWAGMDLKEHLIPSPCHGQEHLALHHLALFKGTPCLEAGLQGKENNCVSQGQKTQDNCRKEQDLRSF